MNEKEKESKRDYSPLEPGFWGTQAQESVNLDGLRGAAGRGVLRGLIRRMLSHHPSRQAGENWLAPRRVEFTGVEAVEEDVVDTCHSLWSVPGSQQQINKISFLLLFTCRGSSPSCCSPLPACSCPLTPPTTVRDEESMQAVRGPESHKEMRGENSKLKTKQREKALSLLEDSSCSDRLTNECPESGRHLEE